MDCIFLHFASTTYPGCEPYHDIVFRNGVVENPEFFLWYEADIAPLQTGTHLTELTLENVVFKGVKKLSAVKASADEPLTVTMKNVSVSFRADAKDNQLFDGSDENTKLIFC